MEMVSVADTKTHLSKILDRIEKGEEIVVTRRGKPIAKLSPIKAQKRPFTSLIEFRKGIPRLSTTGTKVLQMIREEDR
jgi:prevent-host-death family protein